MWLKTILSWNPIWKCSLNRLDNRNGPFRFFLRTSENILENKVLNILGIQSLVFTFKEQTCWIQFELKLASSGIRRTAPWVENQSATKSFDVTNCAQDRGGRNGISTVESALRSANLEARPFENCHDKIKCPIWRNFEIISWSVGSFNICGWEFKYLKKFKTYKVQKCCNQFIPW